MLEFSLICYCWTNYLRKLYCTCHFNETRVVYPPLVLMNRKEAVKKPSYLDAGTNHSVNSPPPAPFFFKGGGMKIFKNSFVYRGGMENNLFWSLSSKLFQQNKTWRKYCNKLLCWLWTCIWRLERQLKTFALKSFFNFLKSNE